jgi:hypothetical protein
LTEQRLVPAKAVGHIRYTNDRPCAFHGCISAAER